MLIQMKDICKKYVLGGEEINALKDVSLEVQKGEMVAIIGPSGSGKSTLMNILGCLDVPDSGTYILDNLLMDTARENELAVIRNQKIGFIFQQFNLLNKLTALQNVELPLIYRGIPAKERLQRSMGALKKVGVANRKDHLPNELSGGQQQRVAIARALAGNPPIILADEPTGALDTKTSQEVMTLLKELNEQQGHTIILITHDNQVAELASRILRIRDGKITEVGVRND
ncbi:ABC transporter ATP-binding protein [Bacillus massiliigorillae]|uniref:ABC transporter ATP-binding protein n=1 Tax=Bacillus massiliigorillae TaxID=1243664 RepID=UPI0003AA024B|nr:ABC transporter ATP-binding protein [Bacillus massiliigorillae]